MTTSARGQAPTNWSPPGGGDLSSFKSCLARVVFSAPRMQEFRQCFCVVAKGLRKKRSFAFPGSGLRRARRQSGRVMLHHSGRFSYAKLSSRASRRGQMQKERILPISSIYITRLSCDACGKLQLFSVQVATETRSDTCCCLRTSGAQSRASCNEMSTSLYSDAYSLKWSLLLRLLRARAEDCCARK